MKKFTFLSLMFFSCLVSANSKPAATDPFILDANSKLLSGDGAIPEKREKGKSNTPHAEEDITIMFQQCNKTIASLRAGYNTRYSAYTSGKAKPLTGNEKKIYDENTKKLDQTIRRLKETIRLRDDVAPGDKSKDGPDAGHLYATYAWCVSVGRSGRVCGETGSWRCYNANKTITTGYGAFKVKSF